MTRETREAQARVSRLSVGEQRDKLNVLGLDTTNFYHRWVNDIEDRLVIFLKAGYVFVDKSEAKNLGDPTVEASKGTDSRISKPVGGGKVAYLMKLPMEFRKVDEAKKEAELREQERAMRQLKKDTGDPNSQAADYGKVDISRS